MGARAQESAPTYSGGTPLRAVIHIGPHKTGTTALQMQMCEGMATLATHGWALPICSACGECKPKHFAGVALHLRGGASGGVMEYGCTTDAIGCFREAVDKAYADGKSIFVSSEVFDELDGAQVAVLGGILAKYKTTIVVAYRNKPHHVMSW